MPLRAPPKTPLALAFNRTFVLLNNKALAGKGVPGGDESPALIKMRGTQYQIPPPHFFENLI